MAAPLAHNEGESIPQWIKKDARLWYEGKISENDFVNCIKWIVEKRIIQTGNVVRDRDSTEVPQELKNIAYFWAIGMVSDKDFTSTVRYLIKNGAIKMDEGFYSQMNQEMKKLSVFNETRKSVVVVPVLTSSAYPQRGFYAYYRGECDKRCLTVKIRDDAPSFMDSMNGVKVLKSLGYQTITDIDIDKNPQILNQYYKVIVLHNEYVTQREFDAITNHPHVVYLYPNSLYAKVSVDYWNNTITLIRGHGYPNFGIRNGFDWKFDNSGFEYDRDCKNWSFYRVSNGIMLNCYPEGLLDYDMSLLQAIKDF